MWKYKDNLFYNLSVIGLAIALASNLLVTGISAKIFYIVSYIAIFYSFRYIWQNRHCLVSDKYFLAFVFSILFIGLVRVIWGAWFRHVDFYDVRDNYFLGGKRFILSIFIIFWFYKERFNLKTTTMTVSVIVLIIGLCLTVWQGYALHLQEPRIKLTADAATTAAYLIVTVSFVLLWLCHQRFGQTLTSVILFTAVMIMTLLLVVLTETRSAVLTTPILFFIYFIVKFRRVDKKIKNTFLVLCLAGVVITPWVIQNRIKEISHDISEYHNNNDTSIGARFSIWQSGWYSVTPSVLGQSPDDRTRKAREYIEKFTRYNPEAYKNVMYNLHNEALEVLSLQGILGLLSLMLFFLTSVLYGFFGIRGNSNGVFFVVVPIIIMGLTDSVLIQGNTVLVVCMALSMCQLRLSKTEPAAMT